MDIGYPATKAWCALSLLDVARSRHACGFCVAVGHARTTVSSSRENAYDDLTGAPSLAARDDKNASALIARSCSAQRAGVPP